MAFFDRVLNAIGFGAGEMPAQPRTPEEFEVQRAQKVLDGYEFQWTQGHRLTIVERSSSESFTGQEFLKKLEARERDYLERATRAPEDEKSQFQMNVELTRRVLHLAMEKITRERKDHP